LLGKLEFSHQEWKEIYGYARRWDIHIFACTYDVPSAQLATQLGVDGIKLNSSDLSNPELLEIVAQSKIPYTLGTGASTVEEIAQAIETSLQHGGDQIIIMHGVQNFPTEIESAQINKVKILQSVFPFPVGYQDHTNASEPFSRVIDLLAIGAGASVIEKHITLDRSEKGTDYQAALETNEFGEFVAMIRMAERALGSKRLLPLGESDQEYRRFQKKSVVASRFIKAGEAITREKVAFLRTGKHTDLSPRDLTSIIGKRVRRDMLPSECIEWQDINW
jgi:sialic acid synthase SpsE